MSLRIDYSRACVIVPIYKDSFTVSESFSFKRTLEILSNWDVIVVAPIRLSGFLDSVSCQSGARYEVLYFPDKYFSSIEGYNRLLTARFFYERFSCYEYMLIVQTDALVLQDSLNEWCDRQYSYVGAPWFKGLTQPVKPLVFCGVGNGGFSLRKTSDFISVLASPAKVAFVAEAYSSVAGMLDVLKSLLYRYVLRYNIRPLFPRVNEDVFWGLIAPRSFDFFTVPEEKIAAEFSFETEPQFLYELIGCKLPFGCHAWERYDIDFWQECLVKIGIRHQAYGSD